jgi:hypothetical protein
MGEVDDLLSKKKISRSMGPKEEAYECFLDGSAIGLGANPVPCTMSSISGQRAKVVVADGHDTGVEIDVPLSSVTTVGSAKMKQAAKDLFRS